jgi:hypothetical protein
MRRHVLGLQDLRGVVPLLAGDRVWVEGKGGERIGDRFSEKYHQIDKNEWNDRHMLPSPQAGDGPRRPTRSSHVRFAHLEWPNCGRCRLKPSHARFWGQSASAVRTVTFSSSFCEVDRCDCRPHTTFCRGGGLVPDVWIFSCHCARSYGAMAPP